LAKSLQTQIGKFFAKFWLQVKRGLPSLAEPERAGVAANQWKLKQGTFACGVHAGVLTSVTPGIVHEFLHHYPC